MNSIRFSKALIPFLIGILLLSACIAQASPTSQLQQPNPTLQPGTTQAPPQSVTPLIGSTATPAAPLSPTTQPVPTLSSTQANVQVSTSGSVQIAKCTASSPSSKSYTTTICFNSPKNNDVLSGDVTITAALTSSGTSTGVQRFVFYLNNTYLLTSFKSPYTFTLPTTDWIDGTYILSVEALMRDAFVTSRANISVQFKNGITTLPVDKNTFQPTSGTKPQSGQPFIVVATGDGASGEASSKKVTDLIASLNPNLFLYLGDVYENGGLAEFYNWYGNQGTFFDRFRSITDPTVGNHEYNQKGAQPYFTYWDNIPNYYSFNAGGWHFISLNANSSHVPTDINSAQYQWLAKDLVANANTCTIVYYHQPLFNIGPEGSEAALSDIWALMAQHGVSIVINGHDHDYQRWVPLDGKGQPSPDGITEFVAGGGGHGLQKFQNTDNRVAYSNDLNPDAFGALELKLNPGGVDFSYVNDKNVVLDSGVIPCHKASTDIQPPSSPSGLAITVASATEVNLAWQASTDNTGVNGYTIYRDGSQLTTVSGTTLAYTDDSVLPQTTYSYSVDAFDLAGNHSGQSGAASASTPVMPSTLTFPVEADTYVNGSSPGTNYGEATTLRLDSSPDVHAYLRFTVKGLAGMPIASASLQIYSNDASSQGFQVQSVDDNTWDERMMNFGNAPPLGGVLATSGPISANSWVTIDLSPYLTGEGTYSFGLSTTTSSALSLPSRESGSNAPQLVIGLNQ